MSRPMRPFQFHPRRAPAVVRQSGSGRTTLHLDMATATPAAATTAAAAEAPGGATEQTAGARGRGSRISGLDGSAADRRGGGGTAGGLRGRRGWWGRSTRRAPPFLEFWGLASGAESSEANGQGRQRQSQQRHRQRNSVWFRSPEFLIFVLGLAALVSVGVRFFSTIPRERRARKCFWVAQAPTGLLACFKVVPAGHFGGSGCHHVFPCSSR